MDILNTDIKSVQEGINQVQNEKTKFIQEVDIANRAKAQLRSKTIPYFSRIRERKGSLKRISSKIKDM